MNTISRIYRSINGSPVQNMGRVLTLMGGIESVIGPEDIVIVKPNLRWWNQGAPNIAAINFFIERIFSRPGGFSGEVILAENSHRGALPWNEGGWSTPFLRNSDLKGVTNYTELAQRLKSRHGNRFSVCHLIDVKDGGTRVYSPSEGPGYVYCDGTGGVPLLEIDNGLDADFMVDFPECYPVKRETIMSYPIMQTDRGTLVDFKNGTWDKGAYSDRPVRLINFSALNHHSFYGGMSGSVRNYLGIADLSGGPDPFMDGRLVAHYYNFHTFPYNCWDDGSVPGLIGYAIGYFMNKIRKADLNIMTAHWCGLASRIHPPAANTKTIMASEDPVALDYHAAKYVLFPNSNAPMHDPDNLRLPLGQYLFRCAEQTGYAFDEEFVALKSYDYRKKGMQDPGDLPVRAPRIWGTDFETILRHLALYFLSPK
ncbi:MAG: DUF362 domain-containing protein [Chitinivibrionales bacterium]|nr:DUF362 domain-containing protein [Chitinivibrionales bacterium]